jgi:hypothetical protein
MFRRRDRSSPEAGEPRPGDDAGPEPGEELELADDVADGLAPEDADAEGDEPEDMEADLESQAEDYLADNDAWLYGPNATAVLAVLDRLEEVGPDDAGVIAETWRNAPKADRDAARKAVRKLTEADLEQARHVSTAREEIGAWLAVAAEFPEFAKAVPEWARLCSQVSEAAMDAITAIILEDELEELDYQALFEPWTDAIDQIQVEELEAGDDLDEAEADLEEAEGQYGPNSDAVADFLTRLWLLSPEQVTRLVSAWQDALKEDLDIAHESLHELVDENPEWREQVRRAQEKISPWLNGGRLEETAGFMGQSGRGVTRRMAGPTLADAAAALVLGDVLAQEDAEALYAPWFNLVGSPALPTAAEDEAGKAEAGPKAASAKPTNGKGSQVKKVEPAAKAPAAKGSAAKPSAAASKGGKASGGRTNQEASRGKAEG